MGCIYFIGAGPGDPKLITVKGMEILRRADVIIYAGSLVNPALLEYAKSGAEIYDSSSMTLEEVIAVMKKSAKRGNETARLHTGDPSLYGAIGEQIKALDELGIASEVVPGVSAFSGAAAALKAEYTLPGVSQSLIITRCAGRTSVPVNESIAALAAHSLPMAVFLSTGLTCVLQKEMLAGGSDPKTPAAIVYHASWPDEKVILGTLEELPGMAEKNGLTKTSLILIGDFLSGQGGRSRLYDGDFSHSFRKARTEEDSP
ncbi:MAG: precorrin-4 C(11)-methyltransferase [Treponema sp.]|jgi:precorrin-4/cobalt-precorrin-4 C11-methyltransferase|nr:precorrin-4 C(11)-methyltransferase [Treponema sp.]